MIQREFGFAFAFTALCFIGAAWYGYSTAGIPGLINALIITLILGIMEVSLSFDNAVVNASVLKNMTPVWQRRFLVWGILIAVVGMRLIFPILIVALTAGLGFFQVGQLALTNPDQYSAYLKTSAPAISAFGGIFLLMVALKYLMDPDKEEHWLGRLEHTLAKSGKLDNIHAVLALILLSVITSVWVPQAEKLTVMFAGVVGLIIYLAMDAIGNLFDVDNVAENAGKAGFASFMYLEVLDASFSLDGVIGAFAITKVVVIIMAGLAIGAVFVRSLTLFLVHQGTLKQYRYLEHGAHYGILALALIMLSHLAHIAIPEVITGLIGVGFIALSIWSSVRANRQELAAA